jgi:DNA-directed RNA polymerase
MTSGAQLKLEAEMIEAGRARHHDRVVKARAKDKETLTPGGQHLFREATKKADAHIKKWVSSQLRRTNRKVKNGRYHKAAGLLGQVDLRRCAPIACVTIVDRISTPTSLVSVAYSVGAAVDDERRFSQYKEDNAGAMFLLEKTLGRTAGAKRRKKMLEQVIKKDERGDLVAWTKSERILVGVVLVELFRQATGLIIIDHVRRGPKRVQAMVTPSEGCVSWLQRSNRHYEDIAPVFMPSIDPPMDRETVFDGAYSGALFSDTARRRMSLVKGHDVQHIQELAGKDLREVQLAVNTLQQTPWAINRRVLDVVEQCWKNGIEVSDLPVQDRSPLPPKPLDIDTDEDAKKKWKHEAAIVYQANIARRSRVLLASKTLWLAQKYEHEEAFYFPQVCDFRGRIYPLPTFLQPQGSDLSRGLLTFAQSKPVDSEGAQVWLAVHGANTFGYDKVSLDDRIDWVWDNIEKIRKVATDPLTHRWWTEADKPWQFLAWCFDFIKWQADETATISTPVHMDGANNGLQIFSFLRRDPLSGAATNCTPSPFPRDIYQDVADLVTEQLKLLSTPMSQKWLHFCDGRLSRKACKRPVMTLPYGSTFFGCQRYVYQWYQEQLREGKPDIFGTRGSFPACIELARMIWTAIHTVVVSATETMQWMQDISDICSEQGVPIRWTSPSGFMVRQEYRKPRIFKIRTAIGNTLRVVRAREDSNKIDPRKQRNGISPNFIHSLDAAVLVKATNMARELGIRDFSMIHDSYGTHCSEAPTMAAVVRTVYSEVFNANLLESFRSEVAASLPEDIALPAVPQIGAMDIDSVKQSLYFFA